MKLKEFSAECIVDKVCGRDAAAQVYRDSQHTVSAEAGQLSAGPGVKVDEHKFVKAVVVAGKLAVFNLLRTQKFRLNHGDLLFLACQHGQPGIDQISWNEEASLNIVER